MAPVSRLVLALLLIGCAAPQEAPARRPNVVILMADDHSADVFGAYGNAKARTPHLDALAGRGVRFDRAYCNQPVCTPSRQSILTGLYSHTIGVTRLETPLPEKTLTVADHFGAQGYRTASIGKMHFNSRLKHGFDLRVDTPEYQAWLKEAKPAVPKARVRGPWQPFKTPAREWLNSEGLPEGKSLEDTQAAYFVRSALDFMKADDPKPFLLWFSLYEPHSPFNFPVDYAGRFDPKGFEVPVVGPEDPAQIPLIFRNLTDDEKRGIAAAYYTSAQFADEMIGRVLAKVPPGTVVVYLSDHGYHLGHHGRFEKHSFFERAVRAPLVVTAPGVAPRTTSAMVELVDLFPTLCELAGVRVPGGLHGRSLVPVLQGKDEHRPWVFSTYTQNEEGMIRTPEWKLVTCTGRFKRDDGYETDNPTPGRYRRLYDLRKDPEEMRDVSSANPAVVSELQRLLHDRLRETWDDFIPIPANLSEEERIDFMLRAPEKLKK
jgi:choline-sulfatase